MFRFNDPTEPPEGHGREINGRRWHQALGTRYILIDYNYKEHLQEIKQNLEDAAGNYLESISGGKIHGGVTQATIFGLVRMIMPSVETIARAKGIGPTALLLALHVPAPNLMWNLYRDMLIHNDEWVIAKVGQKTIRPQIWITMSESSEVVNMHTVNHHTGTHTLNVGNLYYDLVKYLNEEIKNAPKEKTIQIINGVEYLETTTDKEVNLIINEINITEESAKNAYEWFINHHATKLKRIRPNLEK